jgi:hypothetical protein
VPSPQAEQDTPDTAPDRPRAPTTLVPEHDDGVAGLLARALEGQTAALVGAVGDLRAELRGAVTDLRAEARSTRYWFVGALVLAILVLGGVVGVRTALDVPGLGSVTAAAP